jgi:flagellar FliL protein
MATKDKPKKQGPPPSDPSPRESPRESAAEGAPSGKGGLIKIIAIALVAMLLGVGLCFAAMTFFFSKDKDSASSEKAATQESSVGEAPAAQAVAKAPEAEEPIVAPSKGGPAAEGGGHASGAAGAGTEAAAAAMGPIVVKLDPFTTNLNDSSGRRYLKLTLSLEVDDQDAANELTSVMDIVKNDILMLLSSQSADDISSMDGKIRLQNQILNRANNVMKNHKVRRVLYSEFVIQ